MHARIVRVQEGTRRLWDAVLPRSRVFAVTVFVLSLTVFDALSTFVLVGLGVAEEANPLLADLIDRIGLFGAMSVRLVVGVGLTLVLAWLSTWRREARPVLVFVAIVLTLVAGIHIVGTVQTLA